MPTRVTQARTISSSVQQMRTTWRASSVPSWCRTSVKVGTKAAVSDPSAKNLRSRLGMVKATKKASVTIPAPKTAATTMSRTSPATRLIMVAPVRIPVARAI